MASEFRESSKHKTQTTDLQKDNLEFIPTLSSAVECGEDFSTSPSAQINFPLSNNGCLVKQELQTLWEMFTSWLQPEKQTKEQMISQLVLKQFLITGHCKDTFTLTEKWESSDRNMGRFMESLTDECLKPPVMVHVCMQGQEALFSENMPLKEVIQHLKQQQSATRPTLEEAGVPGHTTQGLLLPTGQENSENKLNTSWNATEVNAGDSCRGNAMNSLIILGEQDPDQEEGGDFCEFPQGARASEGNSGHRGELLSVHTTADVPMEAQPMTFSRTNISTDREESCNSSRNVTQVNSVNNIPVTKMDTLFINQKMYHPEPEMGEVSHEVPQDSTRTSKGTSTCLQESPGLSFSSDDPKEVAGIFSRPEQSTSEPVLSQNHEVNLTCESQETLHRDQKPYKCDKCPRSFKYSCSLSSHQRTHMKKKTFVCFTCQKIFKRRSDLRVHEIIHKPEKPFKCSTCDRSFSHKTNLRAHERIHTGEMPFQCSICKREFRQSSTYHRHLKKIHNSASNVNHPHQRLVGLKPQYVICKQRRM